MTDIFSRFAYYFNQFFNISSLLYSLPGIIIGFTFHEFAHAYVAYLLGDKTAKHYGRLTLNPIPHIDPIGFLCLLITQRFGWAKPVPVNDANFKDRRKGMLLVSLAGPAANFLLAFVFLLALNLLKARSLAVYQMLQSAYILNLWLGVFNLVPIPPLDGSKIFGAFLTYRQKFELQRYAPYANLIILFLVLTGIIGTILTPLIIAMDFILSRIVALLL